MTNQEIAAEIVSQLTQGSVVESVRKYHEGTRRTVSHLTDKSVYFTNGKYENRRSMFHYRLVSA